ncbi:ribonuclease D [Pseudomonas saudimassiliensis]|uniref:Ribonuclease D n=2 Tax=Pseudomonas saudimassiliensis TaxID=1461581 RepID=A0A078MH38_9PSED|nr:ribonuclease D [Pseudomonas saudimassiliensis]CEF27222.1 ribonuclease D [Pseudomonas saudimassiliensis]
MMSTEASPLMIDQNAELADWCKQWLQLPYVAVDTEFVRTETYFPIPGLIQIGDGERAFMIDPLAITDWSPLVELLESPSVVKVLHACSEDLEVFQHLCGALPAPLFDTQLAAAFLGMDFSMGYSRLVSDLLGIELAKEETRSDWLQRPLSARQLQYAADDTIHLAAIYRILAPRIEAAGLTDWLLEDTAEMVANARTLVEPAQAYRRIKQAWRLKPAELAVLQVLCEWRERQARQRDQARNRLLRESTLCPLVQRQPDSLQQLARFEDMHPRTVRQDGQTIIELIQQARAIPPAQWPEPVPEPLPADANRLLKTLRKVGQRHAERLGMASEIVLRKKVLEALVRTGYPCGPYSLPAELTGWRRELMGEELLALANQFSSRGQPA